MERRSGHLPGNPAQQHSGPPAIYNVGVSQAQPGIQYIAQPAYQHNGQQQIVQSVSQIVMMQQPKPTDVPGQMFCPHCQNTIVTKIAYKTGMYTWHVFGILAMFLCWLCCCIPFCVNSCKDVEHSCPICDNVLHIHKRMFESKT